MSFPGNVTAAPFVSSIVGRAQGAVLDVSGPRLNARRAPTGAGRSGEVRTELPLYPSRQHELRTHRTPLEAHFSSDRIVGS